jgi:acetyltransferase
MTEPTQTAERLAAVAGTIGRPVLASWLGGDGVASGDATLSRANIPTFATPDTAARAFVAVWRYSENLRCLYETPLLPPDTDDRALERAQVEQLVQNARAAGRTLLNAFEIQQLLAAYGILSIETPGAMHVEQVVAPLEHVGMAVQSLDNAQQVAAGDGGYELRINSCVDPQFGPVLSFGAGGPLAQVFQDRALALPPLTTTLARRMVERTRIFAALAQTNGHAPIDLHMLDQLLVRVSQLIAEQRFVKELVLKVLLVAPGGLLVRDAQVVVYDVAVQEELPPLAIRPYPSEYVRPWTLKDGTPVTIRPIRPEDEPLMIRFHETLSEQSVALRYFGPQKLSQRIAHEQLLRLCFVDYDREMVLVVEQRDSIRGQRAIMGVGCLIKLHRSNDAEVALLVGDAWQGQGIGSELLRRLIQVGRDEGLARIVGDVLPDNQVMLRILPRFGFQLHRSMAEPVRVVLDL